MAQAGGGAVNVFTVAAAAVRVVYAVYANACMCNAQAAATRAFHSRRSAAASRRACIACHMVYVQYIYIDM